ncbi:hypothetical protein DSO57_1010108 [Entomophthora muscae]|uniref:Uncharacterized protein n=1 Tax=Entomophthora muscae TaxID=34485 RepID=A0ACC2U515_9FUNG|nr:hypothetical protein DSO57_1010108 [Entomophthora muscae]
MSCDSDSFLFESDLENDDSYTYLSDFDNFMDLKREETKTSLEIQAHCLENQQLQEMQNEIVNSIASILGLTFDICRALLRGYYWDSERVIETVMDSPSKAYKLSSIENMLISSQVKFATKKKFFVTSVTMMPEI